MFQQNTFSKNWLIIKSSLQAQQCSVLAFQMIWRGSIHIKTPSDYSSVRQQQPCSLPPPILLRSGRSTMRDNDSANTNICSVIIQYRCAVTYYYTVALRVHRCARLIAELHRVVQRWVLGDQSFMIRWVMSLLSKLSFRYILYNKYQHKYMTTKQRTQTKVKFTRNTFGSLRVNHLEIFTNEWVC